MEKYMIFFLRILLYLVLVLFSIFATSTFIKWNEWEPRYRRSGIGIEEWIYIYTLGRAKANKHQEASVSAGASASTFPEYVKDISFAAKKKIVTHHNLSINLLIQKLPIHSLYAYSAVCEVYEKMMPHGEGEHNI